MKDEQTEVLITLTTRGNTDDYKCKDKQKRSLMARITTPVIAEVGTYLVGASDNERAARECHGTGVPASVEKIKGQAE
jgi:hypothetical protein